MFVCLTLLPICPKTAVPSALLAGSTQLIQTTYPGKVSLPQRQITQCTPSPHTDSSFPAAAHSDLSHQHMQLLQHIPAPTPPADFVLKGEGNCRHPTSFSKPLSLLTLIPLHFAHFNLRTPKP